MDLVSDVHVVMECCSEPKSVRNVGIDEYFQRIFDNRSKIAEKSGMLQCHGLVPTTLFQPRI